MGKNSKISWCEFTWNPWSGCNHVSPGCFFCYAEREMTGRFKKKFKQVVRSSTKFKAPLTWYRQLTGQEPFTQRLVFAPSYSDFFHHQADAWRGEAWDIVWKTRDRLIYQLPTKRIERAAGQLPPDWQDGYPNVWLGVSVESPDELHRIQTLSQIPAQVRFISFEPLIDRIPAQALLTSPLREAMAGIHWAIIGGESGFEEPSPYHYRPCELSWITELMEALDTLGIPVFFKQFGTHLAKELGYSRDGKNRDEFPRFFQRSEFPRSVMDAAPLIADQQEQNELIV